MAEYIEREALLKDVEELKKSPWYNNDKAGRIARRDGVNVVVDMCIKQAPAADVVPVVRCGKCKWFGVDSTKGGFCMRKDSPSMWRNETGELKPDDYCSYGERQGNK